MLNTNNWLRTFGCKHSTLESRFPSPLDRPRSPIVLRDRRCVHVYHSFDGERRYLCALPAGPGAWCFAHDLGDKSQWAAPTKSPDFELAPENVVAWIDGVWVDVNTLARADNGEPVDFVDSTLIW
jgi:hypothetical protein